MNAWSAQARHAVRAVRCTAIHLAGGQVQPSVVTKIIFPVKNMKAAVSFYEAIGFTSTMYDDGYAWIQLDGGELFHLAQANVDPETNAAGGYFHVQDVDDWHRRISAAHPETSPLEVKPWKMKEFSLRDPSGNLLRFGMNVD